MNLQEHVALAPLTTFHIGGRARVFVEADTFEDIQKAILFARQHTLPLFVLGQGSNVLIPDAGIDGVVIKIALRGIAFQDEKEAMLCIADAGTLWEDVVDEASARGLFGIENLAGIPGSCGGATVQNIGAYGAELADVFEYADCINSTTGTKERVTRTKAAFAYRKSFFKKHRELVITRVALRLAKRGTPNIAYPDLIRAGAEGTPLATPAEIARAIRSIRALKFPQNALEGTAGSFFKNPIISRELFEGLAKRFPELPAFPQEDAMVKISLAWLLDHALSLKGFSLGEVRLYEKQPLVIIARAGATAAEVDALATLVAERVFAETGIRIEREVEIFGTH